MKKIIYAASILVSVTLILSSCSRKVTRIDSSEQIDLSGRWNNTDSRLTAESMVKDILSSPWISEYTQAKGKKPVVIVGMVQNKSHEHIEAEPLLKTWNAPLLLQTRWAWSRAVKKEKSCGLKKPISKPMPPLPP